jgi:hypothetical protein
MQALSGSFTALAVATIYLIWQYYTRAQLPHGRTVNERVAYMLWTMTSVLQ